VTAQELHDVFADLDTFGREDAAVNKYRAIFIIGMGDERQFSSRRSPLFGI
jgi:asparagine synthetase A